MSEIKLKKDQFIPFLDVLAGGESSPSWKRVDKSTVFSLNPNPQTNKLDYICYETPVTEVDHYEPELPQEIAIFEGNPIYDFLFELFFDLPVGSAAVVPALICFGGADKKAWKIDECTIVLGELNTVDGKLSFTMQLGGDISRGTYTVTAGVPTFTAASAT